MVFGAGNVRWFVADSAGAWTMHPLLDGPRVYFSRDMLLSSSDAVLEQPQLRALDRETGATVWHAPIFSAENAAIAGNVVGAVWGSLPTFDRATGSPAAVYAHGATSLSTNVVSDGQRFYVGTHSGRFVAVEAAGGGAAWERDPGAGSTGRAAAVALEGEHLAVTLTKPRAGSAGSDSSVVAVLDRATGAVRWRVAAGEAAGAIGSRAAPVIANGLVIVARGRYDVAAYDLVSGSLRWQRNVAFDNVYDGDGLTACEGMVAAATGDMGVIALDAGSGAVRWHAGNVQGASLRSLECSHGTLLVLGSVMQVLDARTGAQRARYPLRAPFEPGREFFITSATRDEASLYVGTTFGFAKVAAP